MVCNVCTKRLRTERSGGFDFLVRCTIHHPRNLGDLILARSELDGLLGVPYSLFGRDFVSFGLRFCVYILPAARSEASLDARAAAARAFSC